MFKCKICGKVLNTPQGLKIHNTKLHRGVENVDDSRTLIKLPISVSNGTCPPAISEEDEEEDDEAFMRLLSNLKMDTKILRRIPKGARLATAEALTDAIETCLQDNSEVAWKRLLTFAPSVLKVPKVDSDRGVSLATGVKKNVACYRQGAATCVPLASGSLGISGNRINRHVQVRESGRRAERVVAKVADGDVRGAIRLLGSEDSFAPFDDSTRRKLLDLHGSHQGPIMIPCPGAPITRPVRLKDEDVREVLASFPAGSAGGPDMLLPQHLKDMTSHFTGTVGSRLLSSIRRLCGVIFEGGVPVAIGRVLFGATLCALNKKDGGLRPIAVGSVWRRIVAKIGCRHIMPSVGKKLEPVQMGFGSRGGSEAIVHAVRSFVNADHVSAKVLLKVDFHNAFNSIHRDVLLQRVGEQVPELALFLNQCYGEHSFLAFGRELIESQRGLQQGDPLGPALFCMVVHPLVEALDSELNTWFLDDGALGGEPDVVLKDLEKIVAHASDLGLELNPDKCELFCLGASIQESLDIKDQFTSVAMGIRFPNFQDCSLMGVPLCVEGLRGSIDKKTNFLNVMSERLKGVSTHVAFYLLKNALAIPRLVYTLRSTPAWLCDDNLKVFDDLLRSTVETVINIKLEDQSWIQSLLPVSVGGLGLRSASSLALPAFLASVSATRDLVRRILPESGFENEDPLLSLGVLSWSGRSGQQLPEVQHRPNQKSWEAPFVEKAGGDLREGASSLQEKARLLGVSSEVSGAFLNTLPSAPLGTLLDNNAFRIAVALRLGSPTCEPHTCVCGESVDRSGLHGLRCKRSGGRRSRHEEANDIIKRGLVSAGFPSIREPSFLSREDSKRPDGVTLIPWDSGMPLVWDFTCVDSLAPSYVMRSADEPLYAASLAEYNKKRKYSTLMRSHLFCPIAAECLGAFAKDSLQLLKKIGRAIAKETGEIRAGEFFIQRLSVAIQRGNAAAILGTIAQEEDMGELLSSLL